jgi:hypothetical protein
MLKITIVRLQGMAPGRASITIHDFWCTVIGSRFRGDDAVGSLLQQIDESGSGQGQRVSTATVTARAPATVADSAMYEVGWILGRLAQVSVCARCVLIARLRRMKAWWSASKHRSRLHVTNPVNCRFCRFTPSTSPISAVRWNLMTAQDLGADPTAMNHPGSAS